MGVLARQRLLEIVMAAQAQVVDGSLHWAGILGVIGQVADAAIACVKRRMV